MVPNLQKNDERAGSGARDAAHDAAHDATVREQITPVILSGGSGTRLWPMSRAARPKQFLPLADEATMFEATLHRVTGDARFGCPIVVANAAHLALIEAQLSCEATIILEPAARNTAPAIALAALMAAPDAPLLVMPSDHVVTDIPAFHAAVARALPLARDGWLVTFGIEPTGPETGYGYIAAGAPLAEGVARVERFVEKPAREAAEAMLAAGGHYWNGGIFLFTAKAYLDALAAHAPAMLTAVREALAGARRDGTRCHPDAAAFSAAPSDSIDYAVMEKAERVAVVPVAMGWSDLGSWDALYELGPADADGNAVRGDAVVLDAKNCLIRADGLRIAAVGVEDLIVVASGDSVLILPRGHSQAVKRAYAELPDRAR